MIERRWLPTFGDLLDRISIVALKFHFMPENRGNFAKEIDDLKHDIQIALSQSNHVQLTADDLWHLIILAQFNTHIFYNEKNSRNGDHSNDNLYFTHLANGTRCRFRSYLDAKVNNRQDPKVEAIAATIPDFEPPK